MIKTHDELPQEMRRHKGVTREALGVQAVVLLVMSYSLSNGAMGAYFVCFMTYIDVACIFICVKFYIEQTEVSIKIPQA